MSFLTYVTLLYPIHAQQSLVMIMFYLHYLFPGHSLTCNKPQGADKEIETSIKLLAQGHTDTRSESLSLDCRDFSTKEGEVLGNDPRDWGYLRRRKWKQTLPLMSMGEEEGVPFER